MVQRPRGYAADMPSINQKTAHDKGDSAQRNCDEGQKPNAKAHAGGQHRPIHAARSKI